MPFTTPKKIAAGVVSSALLLFGGATAIASPLQSQTDARADEPQTTTHTVGDREIISRWMGDEESPYTKVANVQGIFAFNQEGTTPNDELFNIFGATLTSMCSKPAADLAAEQGGVANYYVNVGGNIKKNFTVNVEDLSEDVGDQALMACSCATGSPFGQVAVMGVPLSAVVEMADLEDGVNTVTAFGADGFGQPLPLEYALEKNALLVYQVNGQELATTGEGSSLQLFMPETVARYFTRSIVEIELTAQEQVPDVQAVDPTYRNKVNILNSAEECLFKVGDEITFEGVADDLGSPITAIEFSFDNGATWTSCETAGATADKWVNWQFTTTFGEAGDYRMTVRAKTADGMVSPLEATLAFEVA
ncbi:molybdopterin-dependent oxidoreductase [Raoultibacter phocaeensis]|uniref:molybdopterin-dependent oxidoreductase n=1 Tax=Raoultibacter phocaeensis TaxID=2479841 RepID=UPI0011191504|nr:molybdopterin-dependent oxidoreductase [Raoultibacter phocaeensis]